MRYGDLSSAELHLCVDALSTVNMEMQAWLKEEVDISDNVKKAVTAEIEARVQLVQSFAKELSQREADEVREKELEEVRKKAEEDALVNTPVADVPCYWAVSNAGMAEPARRYFQGHHLWEASRLIFKVDSQRREVLQRMDCPENWQDSSWYEDAWIPKVWAETLLRKWQERLNREADEDGTKQRYTYTLEKPQC